MSELAEAQNSPIGQINYTISTLLQLMVVGVQLHIWKSIVIWVVEDCNSRVFH